MEEARKWQSEGESADKKLKTMEYSSTKKATLPDITTLFLESEDEESSGGISGSMSVKTPTKALSPYTLGDAPTMSDKTPTAADCSGGQCIPTEVENGTPSKSMNTVPPETTRSNPDDNMESNCLDHSSNTKCSEGLVHAPFPFEAIEESNVDFISRIHSTLTQVSTERKSLDGAAVAPHRSNTDVNILSDLIDLPVYKEQVSRKNDENSVDKEAHDTLKASVDHGKRNKDARRSLTKDKVPTRTAISNKSNHMRRKEEGKRPMSSKSNSLTSTTTNLVKSQTDAVAVRTNFADSSLQCSLIGGETCRGSKKQPAKVCFLIMLSSHLTPNETINSHISLR